MGYQGRQWLIILLISICWTQTWVQCQDLQGQAPPNDQNDMRQMLKVALDQNRQLEIQNNQLRQVWTGLQSMCRAIQQPSCDCNTTPKTTNDQVTDSMHIETQKPTEPKPVESTASLRVLSISSSGNSLDASEAVNITVYYTAPTDHTVEWIILHMPGGMTRTCGETNVYVDKNYMVRRYTRMQFPDLNNTRSAMLRLSSNEDTIHMRFNLTKVESAGNQVMHEPDETLMQFKTIYEVPLDSDLTIDLKVHGDVRNSPILAHSHVFFSGLNTSTNPPSVFEIFSMNPSDDSIGFAGQPIPNDTEFFNIRVTLKYPYVQYGGILTLRFPQNVSDYLEKLLIGKFVSILSPTDKTVAPPGSLGVYNLPPQTLVYSPSQSIFCAAMGNPRPEVSISKAMRNGSLSLQKTETTIKDNFWHVNTLTVYHSTPGIEGTYVCKAHTGNTSVETKTEVILSRPLDFDEPETGVTKISHAGVIVTCQASGVPRPSVEVRLYDEYGPDMAASGLYKVDLSTPTSTTSRLTMYLTSNDTDVQSVYCVAFQENARKELLLEVFPGGSINWELYNRLYQ